MALLACNNLTLGYDGHPVLSGVSFEIQSGDYLCVVGENGSGKSTLMKTLLGLQKPLSGKIEFGNELHQNEIGYLPQQTAVQKGFPATGRLETYEEDGTTYLHLMDAEMVKMAPNSNDQGE